MVDQSNCLGGETTFRRLELRLCGDRQAQLVLSHAFSSSKSLQLRLRILKQTSRASRHLRATNIKKESSRRPYDLDTRCRFPMETSTLAKTLIYMFTFHILQGNNPSTLVQLGVSPPNRLESPRQAQQPRRQYQPRRDPPPNANPSSFQGLRLVDPLVRGR